MPSAATWMDSESAILRQSKSEKEKYHMTSLIGGIWKENIKMSLRTKQKETYRLRKQTYGCQGEGIVRDFRKVMYTLLYYNGEPTKTCCIGLCSMLCASLDGRGAWGRMDTCICVTESLHCSPETITTLLIGYQFSSVAQLCLTLCDPIKCSMPGLPVHHQLPEFTQTHVHWVGDAIQPSHPLSSPSPPAPSPSQHQSLFQ